MIRQSSNPYLRFNYRPFATSLQVATPFVAATESIEIKRLTPLCCLKGRGGDGLTRSTKKIAISKRVPSYLLQIGRWSLPAAKTLSAAKTTRGGSQKWLRPARSTVTA